jgi:hypothetical protein
MAFHYIGNGAYCYANSLAMLLSAAGAEFDAGYLECVTSVAISAISIEMPVGPVPFFSIGLPDQGITSALEHLGFAFERSYCSPGDDPDGAISLAKLRRALASGPVLAGPLDMSRLTYLPNHGRLVGADHFVLLYQIDGENVFLHDPAGFAYTPLPISDFMRAWRGASIQYRPEAYPMGAYSMWWNLRRERLPSAEEVFHRTDQQIRQLLCWQEEQGDHRLGVAMIRALAEQVRTGVPAHMSGQLGNFALPLAARRCADYARFYAQFDQERAQIKEAQGQRFGMACAAFRQQDNERLAAALHGVADCEKQFQRLTLGCGE